jgi:hypothetical protein
MAVVGNGNIDVGNNPTRTPGEPLVERLAGGNCATEPPIDGRNPAKTEWPRNCGAMSEQRDDSGRGNESAPQELVQLVGYRDPKTNPKTNPKAKPKARPAPSARPRLNPGKR